MECLKCFVFLTVLVGSLNAISTPASTTYRAGVVEYMPDMSNTSLERVTTNVREYILQIESFGANDLDIIVFPEMTLNNYQTAAVVPSAADNISPCDLSGEEYEIIHNISCSARTANRYVVINMYELANCTTEREGTNDTRPCTGDGFVRYNTNVVFDRNGTIISKYRKFNLFGEAGVSTTLTAEIATFTTDFNVTFGHFICFDLLFTSPALDIINLGVTDIIFPTMWFSELPFLTAVQIQQNFAYKFDVNVLAAGANNPSVGSTGSGIFAGKRGALTSTMSPVSERKLLTATVPKKNFNEVVPIKNEASPAPTEMNNLKLKVDQLRFYSTVQLNISGEETHVIQQNDTTCTFSHSASIVDPTKETYQYRAALFNGVRTFDGVADGGIIACAVFACTDDTLDSCGQRFEDNTNISDVRFTSLSIHGVFESADQVVLLPNSLTKSILPFASAEFTFVESSTFTDNEKSRRNITMALVVARNDIYTFGIHGRDFRYVSGASSIMFSGMLIAALGCLGFIRHLF